MPISCGSPSAARLTSELEKQARGFGQLVAEVLNKTVSNNVRFGMAALPGHNPPVVTVGHGISRSNPFKPQPIPMTITGKQPSVWLDVTYQLHLDDRGYLVTKTSFFAVDAAPDGTKRLCHIDFERDKGDDYPEAHIQVYGDSEAMQVLDPSRPLHKLHFPVGGRRFRPSVEDVIEFLICEGLVEGRQGWQEVLVANRRDFQIKQLRAAMARNADVVNQFLKDRDAGRV